MAELVRTSTSDRGIELQATADRQISELIDLFRTHGEGALNLPCTGREKLGDGSVAAIAMHTADNYKRIAGFVQASDHDGQSRHDGDYRVENVELEGLLQRLSAGRAALRLLAELTDQQLDAVPPASEMKFCDGQRTLEQILTRLLHHQSHQVDALKVSVSHGPDRDRG